MILEDIQDQGNLGTIFRTAEAAGVSHIFMNKSCTDIFSPKAVRSTMGSLFRVSFSIEDSLESLCKVLKQEAVRIYAMHLLGENIFFKGNFRSPSAFMLGNEANGLSESLTKFADQMIRIPMQGEIESLNVATTASILLYEVYRQRLD